jgi:hypothetical protein
MALGAVVLSRGEGTELVRISLGLASTIRIGSLSERSVVKVGVAEVSGVMSELSGEPAAGIVERIVGAAAEGASEVGLFPGTVIEGKTPVPIGG